MKSLSTAPSRTQLPSSLSYPMPCAVGTCGFSLWPLHYPHPPSDCGTVIFLRPGSLSYVCTFLPRELRLAWLSRKSTIHIERKKDSVLDSRRSTKATVVNAHLGPNLNQWGGAECRAVRTQRKSNFRSHQAGSPVQSFPHFISHHSIFQTSSSLRKLLTNLC